MIWVNCTFVILSIKFKMEGKENSPTETGWAPMQQQSGGSENKRFVKLPDRYPEVSESCEPHPLPGHSGSAGGHQRDLRKILGYQRT